MIQSRTPDITKPVLKLCKRIASSSRPEYVRVVPDDHSLPRECFNNVRQKIKLLGGAIEHGWQIWEWPDVLVEAEYHAIWISPDGEKVDITPKDIPVDEILFLPDPKRVYHGQQVDNVRLALRNDRVVNDLIKVSKKLFQMQNKGARARAHLVSIPAAEIEPLISALDLLRYMLDNGFRETDACLCGSTRKYKNCCSIIINKASS